MSPDPGPEAGLKVICAQVFRGSAPTRICVLVSLICFLACTRAQCLLNCAALEYGKALDKYNSKRPGKQHTMKFSDGERKQLMFEYMIIRCQEETDDLGKPGIGDGRVRDLCNSWGCHRNYPGRVLRDAIKKIGMDLTPMKRVLSTIKRMDLRRNEEAVVELMKERAMSNRQLLRALNKRTGQQIKLKMLQRKLTALGAKKHKPVFKPKLKNSQKMRRLIFAQSQLKNRYHLHFDIDEKLFYCKSANGYVWTLPHHMTEAEMQALTDKQVESKRHFTKVMIVTAVGRPIHNKYIDFDGKLFISRCCVPYVAQQDSVHHKKGERFDKDVNVNGELYVKLCTQMLAQISKTFSHPHFKNAIITIQHDGAGPHRSCYAEREVTRLGARNMPMVIFIRQSPQSPEQNANDLALYRHLGSVVAEFDYRTAIELVDAIMHAWRQVPEDLLERVFALKCIVFAEIVRMRGGAIRIPSAGLRTAQAAGQLWEFVEEYMSWSA